MNTITITIPADHPALRFLGGDEYQAAASDLVMRARNANAIARAPETARAWMPAYFAAGSGSHAKGELAQKLKEFGVTDFTGMTWDAPKSKGRVIARIHKGRALETVA